MKVAEVGKVTEFTVRTVYQNGQLCKEKQIVEAELKSIANNSTVHVKVTSKLEGVYKVTYTPEVRGRHTMIIKVNGTPIAGSPFRVFAKIHPTQLGKLVRVVEGVNWPWGIALNSKQQLLVPERNGKVTVLDKDGKKVQTMTCGKFSNAMGVAVDKDENIYVSDHYSLFKFSKEGKLVKVVGQKGTQPGEFDDLSMIKIISDKLYICDHCNHRFQVLNTELEYMNSFGCRGSENAKFRFPNDIAQDRAGNLYVSDTANSRVQSLFRATGDKLARFSAILTPRLKICDAI